MHISKTTVLNLPQKKKRVRKHSFFLLFEVLNQKFFKIFCFFKIREERSDDPPRGGADERSGATTGSGRPHAAPAAPIGGNSPTPAGKGGNQIANRQCRKRRLEADSEIVDTAECTRGTDCVKDGVENFGCAFDKDRPIETKAIHSDRTEDGKETADFFE